MRRKEETITADAAERAVELVTTYKLNLAGVKALTKNPQLARRLEAHMTLMEPTSRRVTVKKAS